MNKKLAAFFILLIFLSGCASSYDYHSIMRRSNYYCISEKNFEEEKLVYSQELRGLKYDNILLRNELGKKIKKKEEVFLKFRNEKFEEPKSLSKNILKGTGFVLIAPSYIAGGIVILPVMLASIPGGIFLILSDKDELNLFENYKTGLELFESSELTEAREYFFGIIKKQSNLILFSDIYYWIAKTYDMENNYSLAKLY